MKQTTLPFLLALLLAVLATGCTASQYPGGGYPWPDRDEERGRVGDRDYPFSALGIPKGHLPPPGECKVWFPGKEPGQQPPPQSCGSALREAPLGVWVITHEGSRYRVRIFNRNKRNVIDEERYYQTH